MPLIGVQQHGNATAPSSTTPARGARSGYLYLPSEPRKRTSSTSRHAHAWRQAPQHKQKRNKDAMPRRPRADGRLGRIAATLWGGFHQIYTARPCRHVRAWLAAHARRNIRTFKRGRT